MLFTAMIKFYVKETKLFVLWQVNFMLLISHISKYTHGLSFSVTLLNFTLCELNSELLLIPLLYKHTHHCEYTKDGSMYF